MKKYFVTLLTFLIVGLVLNIKIAEATTSNCQKIYGGGLSCIQKGDISIDKSIKKPDSDEYVDNLTEAELKLGEGNTVKFKITITNTSNKDIKNVIVKDILPEYLIFVSGDGDFDQKNRTLSLALDTLKAKETKNLYSESKIDTKNKFSDKPRQICIINQGIVTANNKTNQDNSKVCFLATKSVQPASQPNLSSNTQTKGGLTVYPAPIIKNTPPTGPEILGLIGLIPAGLLGQFLRKKSLKTTHQA